MKAIHKTLLIAAILIYSGCEGILIQEPLENPVAETFYSNETEAILAINAIYDVLNGTLYRDGMPVAIGMMEDHTYKGTNPNDGFGLSQINSLDIESTNPWINNWYAGLYLGINRANVAIERIGIISNEKIQANSKERLIAESTFLRGLYYFYLVRLFGEVPIITVSSNDPQAPGIPKSSESEVWSLIEGDFMDAISGLPPTYLSSDGGRATSGAATAFLAQAHMWQDKFDLALPLLTELKNSGLYSLEQDFINNFLESNNTSLETVFAIQYKDLGNNSEAANWIKFIGVRGQANLFRHNSLPDALKGESGFGFYMATQEVLENFDDNDIRRSVTFWENGQRHPDSDQTAPYVATASSPFHLNATDLGPKKWFWAQKSYAQMVGVNLALIRYSDVLLMHAETANEVNNGPNSDAYHSINLVRNRAGVEPYQEGTLNKEEFFEAVLRERRAEFVFEFQRWWDLARTRTAEKSFGNSVYKVNKFNPKFYKWPLPQQALDRNPELVQNPLYGSF